MIAHRSDARMRRRYRADARFALYGKLAVCFAAAVLALMLFSIVRPALSAVQQYHLTLQLPATDLGAGTVAQQLEHSQIAAIAALQQSLPEKLTDSPNARRQMLALVDNFAAHHVRNALKHDCAKGCSLSIPLSSKAEMALKHAAASLSAPQQVMLTHWQQSGRISRHFARGFFLSGDSRSPEAAGFAASILGSLLTLLICMAAAFPVGVMAAVYLEEFARKNRLTNLLELAINNLAAVPSILYGLLGLAVLINMLGMPRSSALVGGLTLSMLVLPMMIIATRSALRAVPYSLREAAYGLGSSPLQVVWFHVLPYAMPGIMTGAILSMCRAIGETAPLLMIGMVAFIADVPRGISDATTAMPVQIYLWASSPEAGFAEKTALGIVVLLSVLFVLNLSATILRKRFEQRW